MNKFGKDPWYQSNLLMILGVIVGIFITCAIIYFLVLLGIGPGEQEKKNQEPKQEGQATTNMVIADDVVAPAYNPGILNLDQLADRSDAEIREWYHQLELLSYRDRDELPHAKELNIDANIDSVKQAARDRFPHILN